MAVVQELDDALTGHAGIALFEARPMLARPAQVVALVDIDWRREQERNAGRRLERNRPGSSDWASVPPTAKTRCGGPAGPTPNSNAARSAAYCSRKTRLGSRRLKRRSRFLRKVGDPGPPTSESGSGKPVSSIRSRATP